MGTLRRLLVLTVALALVFSGLSLGLARAADDQPTFAVALQADGTAWLGVSIEDTEDGVTVREVVADSPADEAGLRTGDVITAVDGEAVESAEALVELIAGFAPDDEVTVTVESGGDERDLLVTLGERPADLDRVQPPQVEIMPGPMMGGSLELFGLSAEMTDEGLLIESMPADSPLSDSGLQEGDVITQINGVDVAEILGPELIRSFQGGEPLTLTVLRDGAETDVELDLSALLDEFPLDLPDIELPEGGVQPGLGLGFGSMVGSLLGLDAEMTAEGLAINAISDDSPLADSDLQAGDVITAVNDVSLTDFEPGAMMDVFGGLMPGSTLSLTVLRDGTETTVDITLPDTFQFQFTPGGPGFGFGHGQDERGQGRGPRGQGQGMGPGQGMMGTAQPTQLGVQFAIITAALATERGLSVEEGALIEQVFEDTPAAQAGLQEGDIITAVDGDVVDQRRTLRERLFAYDEGEVVTLTVLREGEELSVQVTLGPNSGAFGFGQGQNGPGGMFFFGPGGMDEEFFRNHPFFAPEGGTESGGSSEDAPGPSNNMGEGEADGSSA